MEVEFTVEADWLSGTYRYSTAVSWQLIGQCVGVCPPRPSRLLMAVTALHTQYNYLACPSSLHFGQLSNLMLGY